MSQVTKLKPDEEAVLKIALAALFRAAQLASPITSVSPSSCFVEAEEFLRTAERSGALKPFMEKLKS